MRQLFEQTPTVTRINVTPIIDVALVLVIILLITAPMIVASEMEIELPHARTRSIEDDVRISITIGQSGDLGIDDRVVSRASFVAVLKKKITESKNEDVLVVVRADGSAPHQDVREIIKDVRAAGAKRIAVATQPSQKRPR